jgi:hypothetical protein
VTQVLVRFQAIGLGRLDQTVQVGAWFDAFHAVTEKPVFPANGKGSDRILSQVVVNRDKSVIQVADQSRSFFMQIIEGQV